MFLKAEVDPFSAHHQVLLDLLRNTVQGSFSVHHVDLGLLVSPGPSLELADADVFVTETECPQRVIGKDLQDRKRNASVSLHQAA